MSLPEWLQLTAEFRERWERCDRLNPEEWMRLDSLFAAIQPSRSFQRTPPDRRQRLLDLWARRESLTVREASQLDRGIRLLVQDIELQEWWSHRDALSDPAWIQFYRLIFQSLRANWGKFGALLKSLPESLDFYIHDFFSRKVFEPSRREDARIGAAFHTGTLCLYFRNYLLDCLDQVQRDGLPSPEPPAGQEPAEFNVFENLQPEDLHPVWDDLTRSEPEVKETLEEAGLHWEQVSQEARKLIGSLEPEDHLLLKCSLCADQEGRIPVDHLKTLLPHPAYRTIKLRKRLQQWLAELLGSTPYPENDSIRLAVLKILCWRALLEIETDCATLRAQLHTADAPDSGAAPSA